MAPRGSRHGFANLRRRLKTRRTVAPEKRIILFCQSRRDRRQSPPRARSKPQHKIVIGV
jgi:hypothetical protein